MTMTHLSLAQSRIMQSLKMYSYFNLRATYYQQELLSIWKLNRD